MLIARLQVLIVASGLVVQISETSAEKGYLVMGMYMMHDWWCWRNGPAGCVGDVNKSRLGLE